MKNQKLLKACTCESCTDREMKRIFAEFRQKILNSDLFKPNNSQQFVYAETIYPEHRQRQQVYSPEFEYQAVEAMRERLREFEAKLGSDFLDNFLPKHPTSSRGEK